MREYMLQAMKEKMRSMYGDLIKELNLTPEQTERFLQLISSAGSESWPGSRLTARAHPNRSKPNRQEIWPPNYAMCWGTWAVPNSSSSARNCLPAPLSACSMLSWALLSALSKAPASSKSSRPSREN